MALHESWHLRTRSHQCAHTQEKFTDGQVIIAVIDRDLSDEGWLRRDYSLAGWQACGAEAQRAFSHWKTTYKAPQATEKPAMLKESPLMLLRRLVDEDQESTENVRFILAVMLERQKILRETDCQPMPSGVLRVYEHRREGDIFLIRDPNVPLDQVEQIQAEVMALLDENARRSNDDAEPDRSAILPPAPDMSTADPAPAGEEPPSPGM